MLKDNIGIISAVLNVSTMVPYVYAVVRGEARPNRATWIIWAFLSWVIFLASAASGAHATLFWLGSAAFNGTLVAGLSFWRGNWQKSNLELSCLAAGILGVIIWYFTHHAYYSVYVGIVVDVIAVAPTVKKVRQLPKSEPIIAWTIGFAAAILNAIAIDSWRPVILLPPLVVLVWHLLVLTPMYRDVIERRVKPA